MRSGFPSARASEPRGFDAPEADTGGRLGERGMGDLATRVPVICASYHLQTKQAHLNDTALLLYSQTPWRFIGMTTGKVLKRSHLGKTEAQRRTLTSCRDRAEANLLTSSQSKSA